MGAEEDDRKNILLLQEYQEKMDVVYQQVRLMEELLGEYRRVKSALEEISRTEKGRELLVPLGGNVFIHASIEDTSKVMTGVGGGVVTEKPIGKAMTFVDKKIDEFLKEEDKLIQISENIKVKVEELSRKLRKGEGKD
ncbi:MAG: prefoldin subunit alpha [Candidatus Thermoplasmatota archaeon]|nr:prefoldin subunit alpha [Candidatus Thermoplasmatota archaeon]